MIKEVESSKWVGVNAPRYTSYPTAPHFSQEVNHQLYYKWLNNIEDNSNISLYIHIPFCKKLCWFCGCTTSIVNHYQPISTYLEFLLKEINLISDKVNKKSKITHIHFGGGSPTILTISDFSKIISLIKEKFILDQNPEISIEIDPRNINEEKIKFYSKIGVNRVSLGVQDFNRETQEAINRIQSFNMVKDLFTQLRRNGINKINIDLIYGLPHQNLKTFEKTINLSMTLKPSRISLFSYAHVPWLKTHQNFIDEKTIVSDNQRLEISLKATEILEKEGYTSIGIDHFAIANDDLTIALKKKTLKRNFQGYTSDDSNLLIGIGLSSIGQLDQGYTQNSSSFREYKDALNSNRLPIIKGKITSKEDRIRKEVIDTLMCFMEVDLEVIIKNYNLQHSHFDKELDLVNKLYSDIVKVSNKHIKSISKHKMSIRVIASIFDKYLQNKENIYSKIV